MFENRRLISKDATTADVSASPYYHDGALGWLEVLGAPREYMVVVDNRQAELALIHLFAGNIPPSMNLGRHPLQQGEASVENEILAQLVRVFERLRPIGPAKQR